MIQRFAAAIFVCAMVAMPAEAQMRHSRMYGPYGYGRGYYPYPWHGYGGYTMYGAPGGALVVGGFPGWGAYGSPYVVNSPMLVSPMAPGLSFYSPGLIGGFGMYGTPGFYAPYPNYAAVQSGLPLPIASALQENFERWGPDLPPAKPDPVTLPVVSSSPDAKLRSLRAIQDGDADLQHQQWLQAYMDYKRAIQAAPDNSQAYFRQGLAQTATQHYDTAVFNFKRALALDPSLPQTGADLETLFGADSLIARNAIVLKIADYVSADVRDPDRLFLFGLWLHFSHDARATEVFEAGYRMAGRGEHFLAFLRPSIKPPAQPTTAPPESNPALQLPPPPPPAPANPTAKLETGPVLSLP